jgi:deoxyribodipyrimidine photo-lyase
MRDNWALVFAQRIAFERKTPLHVVFSLAPDFLGATLRQYGFMLKGLMETAEDLVGKNMAFHLLTGPPDVTIPEFVRRQKIGALVADFDPLRIKREWHDRVASSLSLPFYEVDTHNVVPCWIASQKQEYAAYTFRPKMHRALREFLDDFPPLRKHPFLPVGGIQKVSWAKALETLEIDRSVTEVQGIKPGERRGQKALKDFIEKRLSNYGAQRNDPLRKGQSLLSPYLHFGQISPQRVALEVLESGCDKQSKEVFLEELIVRRELSDNFCFYNRNYDSCEGFPAWARETLERHRSDRRSYSYTRDEFEEAGTHDPLWNTAQTEMVRTGKMHGYMRMYWAKKILEWTEFPEEALETAIYLNDRYELDGRDPNGYTGIAWSIGGVHDRAWGERKIFGKIRYMSYYGCRSKFDVDAYVKIFRQ